MRSRTFARRMVSTIAAVALVAMLFSSCHRGYGCPGQMQVTAIELIELCQ